MKPDLHFPLMWFGDGTNGVALEWSEITKCTPTALRHGFYRGLVLIDSTGKLFKVHSARKVGYPTRFWGFGRHRLGRTGARYFLRMILVDLDFEDEVVQLSLGEFKKRVIRVMSENRDFWSECMMSWHEMKDLIGQAKSFEEVMRLPFLQ